MTSGRRRTMSDVAFEGELSTTIISFRRPRVATFIDSRQAAIVPSPLYAGITIDISMSDVGIAVFISHSWVALRSWRARVCHKLELRIQKDVTVTAKSLMVTTDATGFCCC